MEVFMIFLEIISSITCCFALCFGIFIIPYEIYNCMSYMFSKIKLVKEKINEDRKII